MSDDRESRLRRFVLGAGQSAAAAVVLLVLLHRVMARAEAHPDLLFLRAVQEYASIPWTWPYLIAVALGCALSMARRDDALMVRVQWHALGGGLFLTMYGLGADAGEKVDPRLLFALWAGIASLHSCYACMVGHAVIAICRRAAVPRGL